MNEFQIYFEKRLRDAGWKLKKRGSDWYWQRPGEVGVLYDMAAAVAKILSEMCSGPKRTFGRQ